MDDHETVSGWPRPTRRSNGSTLCFPPPMRFLSSRGLASTQKLATKVLFLASLKGPSLARRTRAGWPSGPFLRTFRLERRRSASRRLPLLRLPALARHSFKRERVGGGSTAMRQVRRTKRAPRGRELPGRAAPHEQPTKLVVARGLPCRRRYVPVPPPLRPSGPKRGGLTARRSRLPVERARTGEDNIKRTNRRPRRIGHEAFKAPFALFIAQDDE